MGRAYVGMFRTGIRLRPGRAFPSAPNTSANEIHSRNDRGNHSLKSAMKGVSPLGRTEGQCFLTLWAPGPAIPMPPRRTLSRDARVLREPNQNRHSKRGWSPVKDQPRFLLARK